MEYGNAKVVNSGRWTSKEHVQFLEALRVHGQDWRRIAWDMKSRNNVQVRTHAQKYFKKLERMKRKAALRQSVQAIKPLQPATKKAKRSAESSSEEDEDVSEDEEEDEYDSSRATESDTDESDKSSSTVKSPFETSNKDPAVQSYQSMAAVRANQQMENTLPQFQVAGLSHPIPTVPMTSLPMNTYAGIPSSQYFVPTMQLNYLRPISMPMTQWTPAQMPVKQMWQVQAFSTFPTAQNQPQHFIQGSSARQPPPMSVFSQMSTPARQPFA